MNSSSRIKIGTLQPLRTHTKFKTDDRRIVIGGASGMAKHHLLRTCEDGSRHGDDVVSTIRAPKHCSVYTVVESWSSSSSGDPARPTLFFLGSPRRQAYPCAGASGRGIKRKAPLAVLFTHRHRLWLAIGGGSKSGDDDTKLTAAARVLLTI